MPLALLAVILAFQIPISTVALFAVVLICPAIHLFMMRGHDHGEHQTHESQIAAHEHSGQA